MLSSLSPELFIIGTFQSTALNIFKCKEKFLMFVKVKMCQKKRISKNSECRVLMPVVCEKTKHARYFEHFHFILSKIMPVAALEYPFWQNAGYEIYY